MIRMVLLALALLLPLGVASAQDEPASETEVPPAVEQLRHVIGEWNVATEFIRPDGTSGGTFDGIYAFEWVLQDRIVKGMSTLPDLNQASGLLFYLRESTGEIEMVSVGPDGQLWTMTGPMESETRETPVVDNPDGSTVKLRFTRFNVTPDRFESRMEFSSDGGATWRQGNQQVFTRRNPSALHSKLLESAPGERTLKQSMVVNADLATAWAHFTDAESVKRWMAPVAEVDLRSGGSIRTSYDPCASIGDPSTIRLNIVNFVPRRLLTLQAELPGDARPEWMSEEAFAARDRLYNVIEFEPVDTDRTRITSWGLGYGAGAEWEQMIQFFIRGNEWSFAQLQKALAGEQVTAVCKAQENVSSVTAEMPSISQGEAKPMAASLEVDSALVFSELAALVGRWEGTNEEGNPVAIEYSLTANGTALVEHWFFHNGMEALTIYHPDGDQMMATHYCPIGNQPRLDLKRRKPDGTLEFEYVAATNLPDIELPHEHAFDLRIIDANTIHRNETYRAGDELESNGTTFTRVS